MDLQIPILRENSPEKAMSTPMTTVLVVKT